jgi:hypothetical protein
MINLSFELDSMETAMPTSKLKAQGEATRPVRKKETPEQYKERRQRMAQKQEAYRKKLENDADMLGIYYDRELDLEILKRKVHDKKQELYLEKLRKQASKMGISAYCYDDIASLKKAIEEERARRNEERYNEQQWDKEQRKPRSSSNRGLSSINQSYGYRCAERITEAKMLFYTTD